MYGFESASAAIWSPRTMATTEGAMRFGILAHSSEGAALCYLTFCREGFGALGRYMHPDVMLDCTAMAHAMPSWEARDYAAVRSIMAQSVELLASGGCDFFACPDNTAHLALETDGPALALPGLNIADVVVAEAHRLGHDTVGLLGTSWVLDSDMYQSRCEGRGIATMVPEPADETTLHGIILDELVPGNFSAEARDEVLAIIGRLAD